MTLTCSRCSKRLSRKTARLIDGKVMCSACMFGNEPWERCRIGSCQRHRECMYQPCRAGGRDRDGAEGGDAKAAPGPQARHARAEGIAQIPNDSKDSSHVK